MRNINFEMPVEFEDEGEVVLYLEAHLSSSSIGFYEYWGAKCYDRGHLEVDEIILEDIGADFPVTEIFREKCESYIDDHFDDLATIALEKSAEYCEDDRY